MVSYASDGGGVGPHFDQYDVFLIQGLGQRRWRVGPVCDAATPLLPNNDLRLLADFTATDEWVLEPGDILYLSPRFAHDGVALGDDCMTYSVGFRAPARSELIAHWADHLLAELAEDDRYADPDLALQVNPGEITPAALDRLHAMVTAALADRAGFARWFGGFTTTPKYPDADWTPDVAVSAQSLARGATLHRNPASRFAFVRTGAGATLFVDGAAYDCPTALAERLCAGPQIHLDAGDTGALGLIAQLVNTGSLGFAD